MAKQESTVFKVGDVVSLKVQPEFRGVIEAFLVSREGNSYKRITENEVDAVVDKHIWVIVSHLVQNYDTKYATIPITHLKAVE